MKKASVLFLMSFVFCASCATNYHIQTLSSDVTTLPSKTVEQIDVETGKVLGEKTIYEGLFKAKDLETAMQMAKKAGFTKILSIEYGTNTYFIFFGYIGIKWVVIRCAKDVETAVETVRQKE